MSIAGPIVCIEDDIDDQHLMNLAFTELRVTNELCFFDNGEKALQFLKTTPQKPFLILCDLNMPGISGLELRKLLNENEYLRKKSIPFLFVTTGASPRAVEVAYDETVQGFFKKADTYAGIKEQLRLIVDYWRSCLHPNSDF